jgi:2-dehydro-3-deoxyphosphooctonate aldolase (KDO 8-P synthase)|tara:strand:- start:3051 stop:3818 length:768 start_codon:yes stop_codon:yes gene_type:complete
MNTLILGPCAMETKKMYLDTAKYLNNIMGDREWVYKASFDKANRSSITGRRGCGYDEAIEWFKEVKSLIPNIKLTTDIHEVWQVEGLKDVIDIIQIPAFLCRQTDLLVESARNFDVVNIKKGQWMSPQNMIQGVDKIKNTNPNCQAWCTERGSQFGYGQLIVDLGNVEFLKKHFDEVVFDVTHSTQRLKENGRTGGDRDLATKYLQSAGIFGYTGVFAECHPNPEYAYSDGDCQINLEEIENYINNLDKINEIIK